MHNWFESKIKYEKTVEEGRIVKVTEVYLIDALTFSEAEERINKEIEPFISGEFTIATLRHYKVSELFENPNGDKWFRAKINFVHFDEERGVEKKIPSFMLVQANDIKEARENLVEGMKGSMADWNIESITETKIMDIYKYDAE